MVKKKLLDAAVLLWSYGIF